MKYSKERRDLDALMKGVQSCVVKAQHRLQQRQERLLEHLIDIGRDGEPKSLSWVCRLPSGNGGQENYELLRLPWASLRSAEAMRIAGVSITFDCRVSQGRSATESRPDVIITPVPGGKKDAQNVHRLQITAGGAGGVPCNASMDGQLFKVVGHEEILVPRKTLRRWFMNEREFRRLSVLKWAVVLLMVGMLAVSLLLYRG